MFLKRERTRNWEVEEESIGRYKIQKYVPDQPRRTSETETTVIKWPSFKTKAVLQCCPHRPYSRSWMMLLTSAYKHNAKISPERIAHFQERERERERDRGSPKPIWGLSQQNVNGVPNYSVQFKVIFNQFFIFTVF